MRPTNAKTAEKSLLSVALVSSPMECDYCHDEEPKESINGWVPFSEGWLPDGYIKTEIMTRTEFEKRYGYCSDLCAWRAKEFGSN